MKTIMAFASFALVGALGCTAPDNSPARDAVDRSAFSLADMVRHAETSVQYSSGVEARLRVADETYAIATVESASKHEVTLGLDGVVVRVAAGGAASSGCGTTISLPEALAIASAEAGGDAVAVVPDDDDPCMREIQVLVGNTLWEIKEGPDGSIIEKELSDEEL